VTKREAKEILLLYRPRSADEDAAEFADALAFARQDAELGRWFDEHCAVHSAIRTRFKQIAVPEGLKQQIISEHKARSVIVWWRQPAVFAAAAAIAILVGAAAIWLNSRSNISAPENFAIYRSRMVKAVLRNYAMTLETSDPNQVRAHLSQNDAPADYVLPAALEKTATVGCGVLSWQDKRVAMVCFLTGKPLAAGQKSDLFLFVVDRNAVPDAPESAVPEIRRVSKLVTASWSSGRKAYVLAMPGDEKLLRQYF